MPSRSKALAWLLCAVLSGAGCTAVNPDFDPARPHHRPDGFVNNYGPSGGRSFGDLVRWYAERSAGGLPRPPSTHIDGFAFERERPDLERLRSNRSEVTTTWIGHATVLLQLGGLNILTDPQFSERAFPVQWAGPKRRVPLPVSLNELPHIDLVVISHNHYDHLDRDTVLALERQAGGGPLFAAPLGVDRWLREQGVARVDRFDWWDHKRLLGLDVTMVPVQHWSARSFSDRNETLWGGWVLRTPAFSFFFAGDTGYSKDFADIGERFGGFDLAAIPVGAYRPRWFMSDQHVDPEEAVRIHLDVRARHSIGIHWGTFELSDEPLDEPIGELPRARAKLGVGADAFVLVKPGETRVHAATPGAH